MLGEVEEEIKGRMLIEDFSAVTTTCEERLFGIPEIETHHDGSYTHLTALLSLNNSIPNLQQHNTHPLTKLLRLDHSDELAYYDHCLELITPGNGQNSNPTARLRNKLLARKSFDSTIAEIEVFNALRRELGVNNVEIEQQAPNGGVPDAKITTGRETIWVEVTLPQPQPSYEIARSYSVSMNPEKSNARANVTKKLRSQIRG